MSELVSLVATLGIIELRETCNAFLVDALPILTGRGAAQGFQKCDGLAYTCGGFGTPFPWIQQSGAIEAGITLLRVPVAGAKFFMLKTDGCQIATNFSRDA